MLNRPAAAPSFPETQALYLLNRNEEEIDALALRPRQGIAYPLVRTESGMRLLGQEDTPLREDVVEDLVGAAAQLEAHEKVADTAAEAVDLSDFGLKDPQLRLTVTYTDGTRTELLLGDEVQHGEETLYYSMRSGDSWIYTVYSGLCEPFFHEAEYLRAFDQPKLQGDLLDRVEVSGAVELSLVYANGAWRMEAPWRYPAAQEKMDATEFFAWYTALANTAPAGRLPEGYAPAGEKQLELTLTGRTGERSVALYAYDKLHSALGVDGTYIFYMDSAFLSRLLAAP